MKIVRIAFPLVILFVVILYQFGGKTDQPMGNTAHDHVIDKAGIISASDVPRFEWLLDLIETVFLS